MSQIEQDSTRFEQIGSWIEEKKKKKVFWRKDKNFTLLVLKKLKWEKKTLEIMEMIVEQQVLFYFSYLFSFVCRKEESGSLLKTSSLRSKMSSNKINET